MAPSDGLRARKKQATRQRIFDAATRLFARRGFEHVTIDEIAAAAGVSRMTLFNYFPCKDDLVIDREPELVELIRGVAVDDPLSGLLALLIGLAEAGHPLMGAVEGAPAFWRQVSSSPLLRARLWSLGDTMETEIARLLRRQRGEADAVIAAAAITAIWRAAWREGVRRSARRDPVARVRAWQVRLFRRGFDVIEHGLGEPPGSPGGALLSAWS